MNRKTRSSLLLALFVSLLPLVLSAKENPLAPRHQEWMDMVHYIITPVEKEVFNQLQNDKERDTFIELFWQQRDPTKGTPQRIQR